jgi:PAS domain-containing protein
MVSETLKDTLNSLTDAITIHDKDYNTVFANDAARKLLDIGDTPGGKCYRLYHGADSPPENCPSCRCWDTQSEAVIINHEPHLKKTVQIRAVPQFDSEGKMTALIHIAKEVRRKDDLDKRIKVFTTRAIEDHAPI